MHLGRRFGVALSCAIAGLTAVSWTAQAGPTPKVTVALGSIGVQQYHPPAGTPGENTAEEPSIGHDHKTDTTMYLSGLHTFAVKFDDTVQPAKDTWTDVSYTTTSQQSLDPILFTDLPSGRTFVSQLLGPNSATAYTDLDGATGSWFPGVTPVTAGVDHQSIGAGPYNPAALPTQSPTFVDAVYYCSQGVAAAFCSRSDDGGLTFQTPAVPVYQLTQCGGLHGHIKVSPAGLAMLPNQNCAPAPVLGNPSIFPNQALVTSNDNGVTWTVQVIPDSHATLRSDPAVAADAAGKIYYGYEDSVSDQSGTQVGGLAKVAIGTATSAGAITWSPSFDVGSAAGVQNVQFPEMIAGDSGRAAYAFLGSTTAGNPEDPSFTGVWDLYLAITKDGGQTWTITDTTPTAPVERGCTYLSGSNGSCPNSKRNLLDFMDITVDEDGHAEVGYAYGCTGACQQNNGLGCQSSVANHPEVCDTGPAASTARYASIARVQCGPSLYAEYDTAYICPPSAGQVAEAPWVPGLTVVAGTVLFGPAVLRRRRRAQATGAGIV